MARTTDILSVVVRGTTFVDAHEEALRITVDLAESAYGPDGFDFLSSSCTTTVYDAVESVPNNLLSRALGGPSTLARQTELVVVCMTTTVQIHATE